MKKQVFCILATLLLMVQGAWAQATVSTKADLRTAVQSNQTVTLSGNIELIDRLDINGNTVALDLNGHTLKRLMEAAGDGGQVIFVGSNGKKVVIK